jgi:hypothetical protein
MIGIDDKLPNEITQRYPDFIDVWMNLPLVTMCDIIIAYETAITFIAVELKDIRAKYLSTISLNTLQNFDAISENN